MPSTKSPRKVARTALRAVQDVLPDHPHPNAPKTYTQPQLLACLVLKRFYKADYRGIVAILEDNPTLQQDLGLKKVPHFTTLQQAHRRLLAAALARKLLHKTVEHGMGSRRHVKLAAVDSTGMRSDRESRHYTRRKHECAGKPRPHGKSRFPKATLAFDTKKHLCLALKPGRGPRPDVDELKPLLKELPPGVTVHHLLADPR